MTSEIRPVDLPHVYSGKVRDIYDAGDDRFVMVTSDRLSAFDVVLAEPIPDKGRVLTGVSAFWFEHLSDVIPNHLISTDVDTVPAIAGRADLAGRVMVCRKAEMLPLECIVRGYITGSAWKEYRTSSTVHGSPMPAGLLEASKLPEPIFTPSTKAQDGVHDMNISFDDAAEIVGRPMAEKLREVSLELYARGSELAAERGVIIADTKFEIGMIDGEIVLADEVLTPDSSRFWGVESWKEGTNPPSFDKQPVRDFLDGLDWDKSPPPPPLPATVVEATRARYVDAYERLTGKQFAAWPGVGG